MLPWGRWEVSGDVCSCPHGVLLALCGQGSGLRDAAQPPAVPGRPPAERFHPMSAAARGVCLLSCWAPGCMSLVLRPFGPPSAGFLVLVPLGTLVFLRLFKLVCLLWICMFISLFVFTYVFVRLRSSVTLRGRLGDFSHIPPPTPPFSPAPGVRTKCHACYRR